MSGVPPGCGAAAMAAGCPVPHGGSRNSEADPGQTPLPDQKMKLSTHRVESSIPKSDAFTPSHQVPRGRCACRRLLWSVTRVSLCVSCSL
jgi:hypothetical protein